jgi:hypothetical protein
MIWFDVRGNGSLRDEAKSMGCGHMANRQGPTVGDALREISMEWLKKRDTNGAFN